MEDKEITCLCGEPFTWTKGEQIFMQELLDQGKISEIFEPKRCAKCRIDKKRNHPEPTLGY